MKTNKTKVAVVGTALSGAAVVALLGGAGPAVAYDSGGLHLDATAQSPARLVARGAAIDVPVDVECNATQPASLSVSVTERVGKQIATGGGFAQEVACTGGHQDILIRVTAGPGKAFAKGTAVATAQIFGCSNDTTCGSESRTDTIVIRK